MRLIPSLVILCGAVTAAAQIVTDGTMGSAGALTGPNFAIPDSLGQTRGNNLFHSFSQFNLASGESATFSGPANIQNVLARVTGGHASTIDGALNCDIAGANFFFINPFGVLFGPNAQVNVSGAFAVTTADYVKLADGGRFDARHPANDILTTAPVSAFGFLGPSPGSIEITTPYLPLTSGTALSIVGGNVIAKNGAYIPSPSSRLAIIATASAGEVAFDPVHPPDEINLSHFLKLGAIRLLQGAAFDTSGDPSGLITLDAADVVLRDLAALIAFNNGDANGKGMVIRARTEILISAGQLLASLLGNGDGGSISLTAPTILLLDRSTLATESYAAGHAGNITLTADRLEIREAAEVTASTDSSGDGGDIFLNAKLALLDFSTIRSISLAESQGRAGDIYVDAKNFQVTESVVSTRASGTADGGNIFVTANNVLINRPRRERVASGLFASCTGGGAGGNITINAGNSVRLDDGQIEANAVGNGGNVHITAPSLVYLKDSKISASSDSGNGGNVLIDPIFVVLQNSQVLANALAGNGGNITILSDYFLSQAGTVDASAGPAGIPGSVTISSPRLDLTETVPTLLAELLDAEAQLQPGCAVRLPGNVSTFTTTGRGGTPFRPDDLQPAPLP